MPGKGYFSSLNKNSSFKDILDVINEFINDEYGKKEYNEEDIYKYWHCFYQAYSNGNGNGDSVVEITLTDEQLDSIINLYEGENKKILEDKIKTFNNKYLSECLFYLIYDTENFKLNNGDMIKLINIISDEDRKSLIKKIKKNGVNF